MKWWVLAGLAAVIVAAAFFGMELQANRMEAEWTAFAAKWESRGESFDVAGNLPPARPGAEEFFAHPWIRKIMAGDPDVLARLAEMETGKIEGWDAWVGSAAGDAPMPGDLAERVERHLQEFQPELEELAAAVGRPGSRFPVWSARYVAGADGGIGKLSAVSKLLDAASQAAVSRDDPDEFTRLVELQLRTADRLRSANLMMPMVVGAGFEASAIKALETAETVRTWPNAAKRKWLAAIDLRKRPLADEYAAALRVNRGVFLEMVRGLEKSASGPPFSFLG